MPLLHKAYLVQDRREQCVWLITQEPWHAPGCGEAEPSKRLQAGEGGSATVTRTDRNQVGAG